MSQSHLCAHATAAAWHHVINTHTWELIALGQLRHTLSNTLLPSTTHSKQVLRPCVSEDPRAKAEARGTVKEPSSLRLLKQLKQILRNSRIEMPGTRKRVLHSKAVRAERMCNLWAKAQSSLNENKPRWAGLHLSVARTSLHNRRFLRMIVSLSNLKK